ncbi:MAG: ribonuclease E/G, partial [Pseudomonadota bacterium]
AVYEGRKLVELHLDRWSDFHRPRIGEQWTGQISAIDASVGGLWVDLGKGRPGLLSFKAQRDLPRLTEGERIDVIITREALAEKGPLLRYVDTATREKPGGVTLLSLRQRLGIRFPDIVFEESSVGVLDGATERQLAVPGGGVITIDQTQALIAIDVDKASAKTVMDCASQAAGLIMSQLRLRGLGGLIAIDYPNLRQPKQRSTILRLMEEAAQADPASIRIAPFSRFGVVEMTRGQDGSSMDAKLNDRFGQPTVETRAIRALRRLTREAKAAPGAQLTLTVTQDIDAWLGDAPFDWRTPLSERMGDRYKIAVGGRVDVRSDR